MNPVDSQCALRLFTNPLASNFIRSDPCGNLLPDGHSAFSIIVGFNTRNLAHILAMQQVPYSRPMHRIRSSGRERRCCTVWAGLQEVGGFPSLARNLTLRRSRMMKQPPGVLCTLLLPAGAPAACCPITSPNATSMESEPR